MSDTALYVRAVELTGFEELVAGGSVPAGALLEKAGLDPGLFRRPDSLMSYRKFAHMLEIAAEELGRPSLGIEYSMAAPSHSPALGPLVMIGKLAPKAQDGINLALQYWKVHTNAYILQQLTDPETGLAIFRLKLNLHAHATRQYTELAFANIVSLCRTITGHPEQSPTIVRFQHAKPEDVSLHDQVFRCKIEFLAEHNELLFNPEFLNFELNGSLGLMRPIVGLYVRSRIRRLPIYDQTMTRTIELAIPSVIGSGNCNIEFIAASIGLSSKKLRRLLAHESTTYSDILDGVRHRLAKEMLAKSDAPIGNIAGLLDYSSSPPFTLAFKRWTGMTPLEFRKRERRVPHDMP
jgi:AraC-like DNA-binding protein